MDCQPYNSTSVAAEWKNCTLRTWLNKDFKSKAFTAKEQKLIPTVSISGIEESIDLSFSSSSSNTKKSQDTKDQIFIISGAEFEKYSSVLDQVSYDATTYAKKQGSISNPNGIYTWWLRSSGMGRSLFLIGTLGAGPTEYVGKKENNISYAIRPSLWIDLTNASNMVLLKQDDLPASEGQKEQPNHSVEEPPKDDNNNNYETLKPGSKGQAVLDARMRLYELGYFTKVPTQTEYTKNMMDYVKKFEKDYGLKQDGILSPEDQEALYGPPKVAVKKVATITAPSTFVVTEHPGTYGTNKLSNIDVKYTGEGELKISSSSTKYFNYLVRNNNEDATISIIPKKAGSATLTLTDSKNKNVKATIKVTVTPEATYPVLKKGATIILPGRKIKIKSISYQQSYNHDVWYTSRRGQRATIGCSEGETKLVIKFDLTNTSGSRMSAEKVICIGAEYINHTKGYLDTCGSVVFPTDYQSTLPSLYPVSSETVGNGITKEMVCLIDLPVSVKKEGVIINFMDGSTYDSLDKYFFE